MRRLLLFDIDGTLLRGGPAKEAFRLALVEVFGTAGPIEDWEFSGKTDPQIARELLRDTGLDDEAIDRGFPALWDRYLDELERRLPATPTRLLPGVAGLLQAVEGMGGGALGLVTGNIARGADLKLAAAGIPSRFAIGGFGSDHEVRNELPGIAIRRANARWGRAFAPDEVVVIGDTPRDVLCGKAHGTRTVAVATGRFSVDQLAATGADVVVADLSETEHVLRLLMD